MADVGILADSLVNDCLPIEFYGYLFHVEKPRDFDPFGHAGFAHLWLQYD